VFVGSVDRNVYSFALPNSTPPPASVGSLSVSSPGAGDDWAVGQKYRVSWNANALVSRVDVSISRDGGATWQAMSEGIDASQGSVMLKAKKPRSETVIVRVTDTSNGAVFGQSGMFHIR